MPAICVEWFRIVTYMKENIELHVCGYHIHTNYHNRCMSVILVDIKGNEYAFNAGNSVKIDLPPFLKGTDLKGKNSLPRVDSSSEEVDVQESKQEVAKVVSFVKKK